MKETLAKIPCTVVTGFLGSGKTTLLGSILRQTRQARLALIVNEFGERDIDAELLGACCAERSGESGIYELPNGCLCCTVEEEFLPVMRRLVREADSLDHILIETSGLALPKPLIQAFRWPEIRTHCTVDAVLTVVDGPAVLAGDFAADPQAVEEQRRADANLDHQRELRELWEDQLSTADLVVVAKSDLLSPAQREELEARLRARLPRRVRIVFMYEGVLDRRLVLGLEREAEEHIEGVADHHGGHHAEGQEHRHAHDHFSSVVVELPPLPEKSLRQAVEQVLERFPVYRLKGFAALPGKELRQVVQGVGERVEYRFDRPWRPGEERRGRLVLIGIDIPKDAVQEVFAVSGATAQPQPE